MGTLKNVYILSAIAGLAHNFLLLKYFEIWNIFDNRKEEVLRQMPVSLPYHFSSPAFYHKLLDGELIRLCDCHAHLEAAT